MLLPPMDAPTVNGGGGDGGWSRRTADALGRRPVQVEGGGGCGNCISVCSGSGAGGTDSGGGIAVNAVETTQEGCNCFLLHCLQKKMTPER